MSATPAQQQIADPQADVRVDRAAYPQNQGPVVAIDAAHRNFHTAGGRYAPFANILLNDGYRVASLDEPASPQALGRISILVVANAGQPGPDRPAFAPAEAAAIHDWVENGGSLLLIADHAPFGAAANSLAELFGIHFDNGFAFEAQRGPERFSRRNRRLLDNPLLHGDGKDKAVDEVYAFTGTSFTAPAAAIPVMKLGQGWTIYYPKIPWQFDGAPSRPSNEADLRGATIEPGKGRVAIFAEAAMFTAQRSVNGGRMGFNFPAADQNKRFLLNTLHWLSREY